MTAPQSDTYHVIARYGVLTAIPRAAISTLDTLIRRAHDVREFTDDELCLIRIALVKSERDIILSDGTRVGKGETIGELHLWNEHIPPMPEDGAYFTWGIRFYSLVVHSFRILIRYLADHPELDNIRAWRGESSFAPKGIGVPDLFSKLGFDVVRQENPPRYMRKFADFWQNFYWWMLAWTFNPLSLKYKELLKLERWQIWISSAKLHEKYGSPRARM